MAPRGSSGTGAETPCAVSSLKTGFHEHLQEVFCFFVFCLQRWNQGFIMVSALVEQDETDFIFERMTVIQGTHVTVIQKPWDSEPEAGP